MASAPDIITYVGVPLTVLGVSPIIYTCTRVLVTIRNIRKALRANALDAVIRGSIVSGIVEVELPRCSITPLTRDEAAYWEVNNLPSSLKGGSWTILHWNRLITGKQLYRLQYADELVEPQAEVDFEELLTFLLDRGAIPDIKGLHTLRLGGLWTPTGTSLLLSPHTTEGCLRVSVPDDGLLTLTLLWKKEWDQLEESSLLPPSFMRLEAWEDEIMEPTDSSSSQVGCSSLEEHAGHKGEVVTKSKPANLDNKIKPSQPKSVRFSIKPNHETFTIMSPVYELKHQPQDTAPPCLPDSDVAPHFFPSLCIAVAHLKSFPLWTCHLPAHLITLSKQDTIPSGVLVMLNLLPESDAPPWETKHDVFEDLNAFHNQSVAQSRARTAESLMPPAQAELARRTREIQERDAFHNNFVQKLRRDAERAERRKLEALQSVRFSNEVAASRSASWLKENSDFGGCKGVIEVGERILYLMMKETGELQRENAVAKEEAADGNRADQPTTTLRILKMLVRWEGWSGRGGLQKEDLAEVKNSTEIFCQAAVLMGVLRMAADKEESQVAVDIKEVVRTWQRVRLG